jgi:hypothetical protein
MSPGNFELEDTPTNRSESTFGLQLPVRSQIPRFAQRQMHLLIEVFAEIPIAAAHFVGDVFGYERPRLVKESLVLGRECDP